MLAENKNNYLSWFLWAKNSGAAHLMFFGSGIPEGCSRCQPGSQGPEDSTRLKDPLLMWLIQLSGKFVLVFDRRPQCFLHGPSQRDDRMFFQQKGRSPQMSNPGDQSRCCSVCYDPQCLGCCLLQSIENLFLVKCLLFN